MKSPGHVAYDAWAAALAKVGWNQPAWHELAEEMREAWEAAADSVPAG